MYCIYIEAIELGSKLKGSVYCIRWNKLQSIFHKLITSIFQIRTQINRMNLWWNFYNWSSYKGFVG